MTLTYSIDGRVVPVQLRKPQQRILKCLARAKSWLSRAHISERAEVDIAWVGDHLGKTELVARTERERITGYPSLITLGYVETKSMDVYGDGSSTETNYRITQSGRQVIKQIED